MTINPILLNLLSFGSVLQAVSTFGEIISKEKRGNIREYNVHRTDRELLWEYVSLYYNKSGKQKMEHSRYFNPHNQYSFIIQHFIEIPSFETQVCPQDAPSNLDCQEPLAVSGLYFHTRLLKAQSSGVVLGGEQGRPFQAENGHVWAGREKKRRLP